MKPTRGLSLTFSTIIIIIILTITLVAMLMFFGKGFTASGEQVGNMSKSVGAAATPGRMNPANWDFLCNEGYACDGEGHHGTYKECQESDCAEAGGTCSCKS